MSGAGAIGTGSHTDAIPYSGMYDGTVGVLGGLEAISNAANAGKKLRRSLEVLMFTSGGADAVGDWVFGEPIAGGGDYDGEDCDAQG